MQKYLLNRLLKVKQLIFVTVIILKVTTHIYSCIHIIDIQVVFGNRKPIDLNTVIGESSHNTLLELGQFTLSDRVGLSHNGYNITLVIERSHRAYVERFERVTGGREEVETRVNAFILGLAEVPIETELFLQIGLELRVHVGCDGLVRVLLVYLISVATRLNYVQSQFDAILFDYELVRLETHCFVVVIRRFQFELCVEQCVYQCAFTNSSFTFLGYNMIFKLNLYILYSH